jgi:diaminohydroxyphosphoribosylaminopyrimidine deaminase / 5-amino-6-(5-phosphoribosylamino)uracil reductase
MTEAEDIKYMQRCLELAEKAAGMTYPNPLVGSVITYEGRIIGEGYHRKAGEAHAEVNAISSVADSSLLDKSTIYVNLEPCSHFGKTPPCADMIIEKGIKRVVIGTGDTSSKVGGKGIKKLKESGCEVITGVLENESRMLNRRFFTFIEKKRPYIILKWAQSEDGFIDIKRNSDNKGPNWITGKPERVLVHKWRSEEQSILAGATTVRIDDPMLNVREWSGNNPLRLILSGSGNISDAKLLSSSDNDTVVFTYNAAFRRKGIETVLLEAGRSVPGQIADYLYERAIQSVFIEGGAAVFDTFISERFWDEMRVFTGKEKFGDGVRAPGSSGVHLKRSIFTGSTLDVYINPDPANPLIGK